MTFFMLNKVFYKTEAYYKTEIVKLLLYERKYPNNPIIRKKIENRIEVIALKLDHLHKNNKSS